MLTRYVKIFADFVIFRNIIEKFVAYTFGIEIKKPYPGNVQLAQLLKKVDEKASARYVVTVTGDILRNDYKFLYRILSEQFFRLVYYIVNRYRGILSSYLRYGAICAMVVEAFRDL